MLQNCSRWPKMSHDGPKMAVLALLGFTRFAFVLQWFCPRVALTLPLLCSCFAFVLPLFLPLLRLCFCLRFAFVFAFALLLFCCCLVFAFAFALLLRCLCCPNGGAPLSYNILKRTIQRITTYYCVLNCTTIYYNVLQRTTAY